MNSTAEQPPPPPALQPPRSSFSCDRHPAENFTNFCPSCLCERLTTLDQSTTATVASSSRRNSTSSSSAAAALKSIFRVPSSSQSNKNKATSQATGKETRDSSFPELRRTKSFSASENEGLRIAAASAYEPQRKSCDVRGRNTLWSLFSIHDENKPRHSYSQQQTLGNNGVVLETNREDDEEEDDEEQEEDQIHEISVNDVDEDVEITQMKVTEEPVTRIVNDLHSQNNIVPEIVPEIEEKEDPILADLKPMKDHIDLDSRSRKPPRSNFWSAASVLGKKWQKWRRKQKDGVSAGNGVVLSSTLPVEKPISRQFRETQSEIADYGFGRRSCDTDPRFSLDVGRISFDDPRYSFDEPRASWDGYLIGRTFPRLPPMVEDAQVLPAAPVPRCDSQIPVENVPIRDDNIPGGSIQTREYYLDSSSKRRKSLDRSNSIRRMAAAVVAELDETKVNPNPIPNPNPNIVVSISNTKVSPATIDYSYNPVNPVHGVPIDPPRVSNSNSNPNSLRDDWSETFELGLNNRDNGIPKGGEVNKKELKKPRKWRWKIWGFIQRRNKDDEEDGCSTVTGVGRSYSESWQETRDCNNEMNNGINRKVFRSNSSVSWRSSSMRKSNPNNINNRLFGNAKNRRTGDEFVLERNRSARYSPSHTDNGLLRFYLAPLSGSRRSGIATRPAGHSHSIARSMLRLF